MIEHMSIERPELVDDELARARILENVIEREARRAKAREVVAELAEWCRLAEKADQALSDLVSCYGALKQLAQQFHDATDMSDGNTSTNGVPHTHSFVEESRSALFSALIGTDFEVQLVKSTARSSFARFIGAYAKAIEDRATGNGAGAFAADLIED
jgi:hypothetical protein